jgi:hypothetical protein
MIRKSKDNLVRISIYQGVLDAIFDECDQYDSHETGGRLIGTFKHLKERLTIEVSGVIEPGPAARRTATSFFQDGAYQEEVFRSIEGRHPEIEHLGNWHTHHVNGYPHLSPGDIATYQKTVNHPNHNTDIFYGLLIVSKTPNSVQRYNARHYLLRRGDSSVDEIPESGIQLVHKQPLWPTNKPPHLSTRTDLNTPGTAGHQVRAYDQEMFSEMYPQFKPYFSKSMGAVYWKGNIELIDGTKIDVVVIESKGKEGMSYSINPVGEDAKEFQVPNSCTDRPFKSARMAVWQFERDVNPEIYSKTTSRS